MYFYTGDLPSSCPSRDTPTWSTAPSHHHCLSTTPNASSTLTFLSNPFFQTKMGRTVLQPFSVLRACLASAFGTSSPLILRRRSLQDRKTLRSTKLITMRQWWLVRSPPVTSSGNMRRMPRDGTLGILWKWVNLNFRIFNSYYRHHHKLFAPNRSLGGFSLV